MSTWGLTDPGQSFGVGLKVIKIFCRSLDTSAETLWVLSNVFLTGVADCAIVSVIHSSANYTSITFFSPCK